MISMGVRGTLTSTVLQVADFSSCWDVEAMSAFILTLATWKHRLSRPACEAVRRYLSEHGPQVLEQAMLPEQQTAGACLCAACTLSVSTESCDATQTSMHQAGWLFCS